MANWAANLGTALSFHTLLAPVYKKDQLLASAPPRDGY